jgi:putative membrane protein
MRVKIESICLFGVLGLTACAKSQPPPATAAKVMPASRVSELVMTLPQPDRDFVKQVSGAHMAAIRMGQLAMVRGYSPTVRDMGREMVDTHTDLDSQLRRDVLIHNDVELPVAQMTPQQRARYQTLFALRGPAFDQAYLQAVLDTQNETLKAFNQEALDGRDPDIRDLANSTLPTLNDRIRTVRREMSVM